MIKRSIRHTYLPSGNAVLFARKCACGLWYQLILFWADNNDKIPSSISMWSPSFKCLKFSGRGRRLVFLQSSFSGFASIHSWVSFATHQVTYLWTFSYLHVFVTIIIYVLQLEYLWILSEFQFKPHLKTKAIAMSFRSIQWNLNVSKWRIPQSQEKIDQLTRITDSHGDYAKQRKMMAWPFGLEWSIHIFDSPPMLTVKT